MWVCNNHFDGLMWRLYILSEAQEQYFSVHVRDNYKFYAKLTKSFNQPTREPNPQPSNRGKVKVTCSDDSYYETVVELKCHQEIE